jgi:hypothetical protein
MCYAVSSQDRVDGGYKEEDMVHYIVKREFSEGSIHVKSVVFPLAALHLNGPPDPESDFR